MPLPLRCRTAVLSAVLILSLAGCGPDTSDSGKASRTRASPTSASPSAGLPEGDSWRSAYVSESDDAEIRDVAAASATEGWAIGRDRIHVSTAIEKASGYSTFFLHYDGEKWRDYDAAAELPKLATLGLTVLEASGPDNVWLFSTDLPLGTLGTDPAFARWDGKHWREVPLPPSMTDKVKDAAVFAPDDVWLLAGEQRRPAPGHRLASEQAAWHWDGSRWTSVPLPAQAEAIDGRSGDDIWAVGNAPDDVELTKLAAMHYDGHSWRLTETPRYRFTDPSLFEPRAGLDEVLASETGGVWATGQHTFDRGDEGNEPEDEAILLRWDGSRWVKEAAPDVSLCCAPVASDGAGGLVFGEAQRTAEGKVIGIGRPPYLPGKTGKVTEADRRQRLLLHEIERVPGTQQVWGVGDIGSGGAGEENFYHGVVVTYGSS
ncbi:hypothetical protein ACIHCV_39565 [Streptomyces sp. NPDC051956]|uniref:hypothetical protein n=1 Tax=Streptomyces sp. NPDC051956 TaxID=3365677 RepID=UPI0037D0CD49